MSQTEQQSKQKFIALMANLIGHIEENPAHQLTIYECLNTQQIKRLFQSLHDHSRQLRITALIFIAKLLYNAPQIVDTLLLRDNCDLTVKKSNTMGPTSQLQKYLITGLKQYGMEPFALAQTVQIINNKVKVKRNTLFWAVEVETKAVSYFGVEDDIWGSSIDPRTYVIGIFVGEIDTSKDSSRSITPSTPLIRKNGIQKQKANNSKYTISKTGQFSHPRKI